jgi:hypothetical protein
MTEDQLRRELGAAVYRAVHEFSRSTRGASVVASVERGSETTIRVTGRNGRTLSVVVGRPKKLMAVAHG